MKNPRLTFVTPTLLAGDRSLVDVVVRKISHFLMTNLTWTDFGLNEGWAMWVERKIQTHIAQDPKAVLGLRDLIEWLHLPVHGVVPNMGSIDPDEVFSSIPKEKGFGAAGV
ncbi:hypothetical protein PInf_025808 [Phytophthora infestans]|nr:hypothetical protein PInf_025807 [Phytophthora infestans]KAI9986839.1 hypothetical protein PInf_025808 [Phytophthora infestans]